MAKMLVALAVVMMHGVMAKRSNTWLADTKHLSVREQSEEEPSSRGWDDILDKPLNVTASAVAFCAELLREVDEEATEDLCPKVLTGSLGDADPNAMEWEKKAAKVAQQNGKHDYGRLDNVPWKKSLHRVCHDECHALVKGIEDKTGQMVMDLLKQKFESVEEICADNVVREVESEIMTCCARSCGWNNHSCMFWPLMSSTEQADWESECCVEMNILNGSTRERLCDSTLSKHDKEESYAIIDKRPNTAKDREILGQDGDVSVASSFMETSSMRSFNGQCPPPLNLDQLHKNWTTDWKVMALQDLKNLKGKQTVSKCAMKKDRQPTINGCKVFLLLQAKTAETNSEEKQRTYDYKCLDDCHMQKTPQKNVRDITDKESSSSDGIVYIHKDKLRKSRKS